MEGVLSVCDTGFDVSYLLSTSDSLMASYTDQTLLGNAMNLNLNRDYCFQFSTPLGKVISTMHFLRIRIRSLLFVRFTVLLLESRPPDQLLLHPY